MPNYDIKTNYNKVTVKCAGKKMENDLTVEFQGGGGGGELNIHYGTTAPEDTSKLWVKSDITPSKVMIKNTFNGAVDNANTGITATTLTKNLYDTVCGVVGTKCYIFGGSYYSDSSYTNETIYCYNTETDTIEAISNLGNATRGVAYPNGISCGVVGTKCYIFGGYYTYYGTRETNAILCYDTENNKLELTSSKLINVYYGTSCGVVGTKCYIFGGTDATNKFDTIQCYDAITDSVKKMNATLPEITAYVECGVVGTKCYIFSTSGIYCYDTETDTLKTMNSNLPEGYSPSSCIPMGTKCYLIGGSLNSVYTNNIYCYDTETDTIEILDTTLSKSASNCSAGLVGNKIYVFGGTTKGSGSYSSQFTNTIQYVSFELTLVEGTLKLINGYNKTPFKLINSDTTDIELSVEQAFIGNSNNEAEVVKIATHNGSEWIEIN